MSAAGSSRRDVPVDAVRGAALLGSTVATALLWLGGRQLGTGFRPVGGSPLDRGVDAVTAVLVDNRTLPVFALLLGYAVAARMLRRDGAPARGPHAAPDEAEWGAGLRRAGVLLGLGALHATAVLEADVLGTLAVLVVIAVPLVRARTRTHVVLAVLVVPALLVNGAVDGLGGTAGFPDPPQDYLLSVVDRVGTWLLALVLLLPGQSGLVVALVLGIRLARSGWGRDPAAHRRGLLLTGAVAGGLGLAGSLPYARVLAAGVVPDVVDGLVAGVLDSVSGPAGALGAVCLALLGTTVRRRGVVVGALALLGRGSLRVYLGHSVVLAMVLAPWAGGAGQRWGSTAVTGLAVGLWAVTLGVGLVLVRRRAGGARGSQPSERQGRERSSAT